MTKLAPEWVRTSDPVIRSPARYRWTNIMESGEVSQVQNSLWIPQFQYIQIDTHIINLDIIILCIGNLVDVFAKTSFL